MCVAQFALVLVSFISGPSCVESYVIWGLKNCLNSLGAKCVSFKEKLSGGKGRNVLYALQAYVETGKKTVRKLEKEKIKQLKKERKYLL